MHLWQYKNEMIISQFSDTSGDTNKQLINGQKIIDIRPRTRYNISNLIRKLETEDLSFARAFTLSKR